MSLLNLNERVDLYNDYLNNGGIEKLWDKRLLKDLMKVKKLTSGSVDINTISPLVNAAMLAHEADQRSGPVVSEKYISEYQSLFQKTRYFRQKNIETKNDFDEIFNEFKNKKDTLFRGLSAAKYRLYSSLQRNWISNKIYEKEKTYVILLRELIENAKKANGGVLKIYLEKINLSHESDIGILSFLQHYGCPTPLLDWTYNFSIALFFATKKNKHIIGRKIDDYFCIYYLEEEHLKDNSLNNIVLRGLTDKDREIKPRATQAIFESFRSRGFSDVQIRESIPEDDLDRLIISQFGQEALNFLTKIEHIINSPILYFSDTKGEVSLQYYLQNNMNIVNQEGAFTWNAHATKPLEQVANEEYQPDDDSVDYKFSKCINIHKSLIPYVQEKLKNLGIVEGFVYPKPHDIADATFKSTLKNL